MPTTFPRKGPSRGAARVLVHYRLPPALLDRLSARAARLRTSRTALVEAALRAFLGRRLSRREG